MTRILIVDDHEAVRRGVRSVLERRADFDVCGEAVDGRDGVEKAKSLKPDVVVMDVSMPNLNGLEATQEICRLLPEIQVLILSQHESEEMVRQAFKAGACGYVVKSSISQNLLGALDKMQNREPFLDPTVPAVSNRLLDTQEIIQRSAALEKQLRESEERFLSAMASMAEGLYTVDTAGLVTAVNPAACSMFGWTSAELLGKKMHDVIHYRYPDGRPFPASECPFLQILQKGQEVREHADTFIRKDGIFFPVVFSASPLRAGDKITGVVVVFRDNSPSVQPPRTMEIDITGRAGAEEQLRRVVQDLEKSVAERTRDLEKRNDQLKELSGRLLRAQDDERRRVARELHDGIGQLLAAMGMNTAQLAAEIKNLSPAAARAVEENATLIEQATKDIRTMSHLLHPPLLDEVGLESALKWYVEGFGRRSKITISLSLGTDVGRLPRDAELCFFRIVQESLTNIHRHSGSSTAAIRLYTSGKQAVLEVRDSGKGISEDTQSKLSDGSSSGVGLRGMLARMRQLGGNLDIQSDASGTLVSATIPLAETPMAAAKLSAGNKGLATRADQRIKTSHPLRTDQPPM